MLDFKEFAKTLTLFVLVGFGITTITEFLPFMRNYTVYTMFFTLMVLSFLVEKEQHSMDGTLRYLVTDSLVDFLSALGAKKIIELLPTTIPFVSSNYGKYATMLAIAAVVSSIYNSTPSDNEGA